MDGVLFVHGINGVLVFATNVAAPSMPSRLGIKWSFIFSLEAESDGSSQARDVIAEVVRHWSSMGQKWLRKQEGSRISESKWSSPCFGIRWSFESESTRYVQARERKIVFPST